MPNHHFTLTIEGPELQSEPFIDTRSEAGCEDATPGPADGVQYLDFDREAEGPGEAIISAMRCVEQVERLRLPRVATSASFA